MPARKAERLMNLVILLLVAREFTTKQRIRELLEDYRDKTDDAFERMFERDKDDLRALGIPLETGSVDRYFDDEQGYRIRRDAFELPPLDLAADEVAVLGLAARVWEHASLASATSNALVKLTAAGLSFDREQLDRVQPTLRAEEPAFEPMLRAVTARVPISFGYQRPDEHAPSTRHLQPWGLVTSRGRWYVVGLDTDREQPRMFRLSRVSSEVTEQGRPGDYTVPDGTDVRALSTVLLPPRPDRTAVVLARSGAARDLRRRSGRLVEHVLGPDGTRAWDRLELLFGSGQDLVEELLGHGDAVFLEGPADLREELVGRLDALLAATSRVAR